MIDPHSKVSLSILYGRPWRPSRRPEGPILGQRPLSEIAAFEPRKPAGFLADSELEPTHDRRGAWLIQSSQITIAEEVQNCKCSRTEPIDTGPRT